MKKTVGIVGSREYVRLKDVEDFIVANLTSRAHRIVSGGARGVDSEAARVGRFLGFEVKEHLPTDVPGPGERDCTTCGHDATARDERGRCRADDDAGDRCRCEKLVVPMSPYGYAIWKLFARNTLIARDADVLHAFINFGRRSNGTFDTIAKAAKEGKPITVHYSAGGIVELNFPVPPTKARLEQLVYYWERGAAAAGLMAAQRGGGADGGEG